MLGRFLSRHESLLCARSRPFHVKKLDAGQWIRAYSLMPVVIRWQQLKYQNLACNLLVIQVGMISRFALFIIQNSIIG